MTRHPGFAHRNRWRGDIGIPVRPEVRRRAIVLWRKADERRGRGPRGGWRRWSSGSAGHRIPRVPGGGGGSGCVGQRWGRRLGPGRARPVHASGQSSRRQGGAGRMLATLGGRCQVCPRPGGGGRWHPGGWRDTRSCRHPARLTRHGSGWRGRWTRPGATRIRARPPGITLQGCGATLPWTCCLAGQGRDTASENLRGHRLG